ncbi:hypothetical protein [Chryseobacterium sp. ISL-6]|uniref:hypothetical protein n=1 Tax=Chryseobacterium sp. ISL-6 TaxID=2819143 RepID=UPI001BE7574F|nr:hypothetical protein [Chryseobacterium sp. ISL-6]MBT2621907.1 hypothetical protein [Chryseobacterium sp. ISL-6]
MAKRLKTKIGDIFSITFNDKEKQYMQLIAFDSTQLNSDVIRVFKKIYHIDTAPKDAEIVNDEVLFYAHSVTDFGLKLQLWEKIGNTDEVGNTRDILFRGTSEYGEMINNELIRISDKWYVWTINNDFIDVGKLEEQNKKAEIGIVVNPYDIVDRIKIGRYNFFYPDFE